VTYSSLISLEAFLGARTSLLTKTVSLFVCLVAVLCGAKNCNVSTKLMVVYF
jgi:hypothetical protein